MKRFFKKRWHGIPVGAASIILALMLVGGGVFAAMVCDQTITQQITPAPVATSVTCDSSSINLPSLQVNKMNGPQNDTVIGTVTVVIGNDGAGNWLHLILNASTTSLYSTYGVYLISPAGDNPMGVVLLLSVNDPYMTLDDSIQLTAQGTYVFEERAGGQAGPNPGTANVVVTINLQTS